MKICQNLTRKSNSSKNLFRSRILPILAWFWGPQATSKSLKMDKKASRKNSKKIEGQKTQKNQKKLSDPIDPSEIAGRGEDIGGEKKTFKTAKNDAKKWRQKLKQKIEGNERLEDEDKMLKRQNLGWSSTPHTGAADCYHDLRRPLIVISSLSSY